MRERGYNQAELLAREVAAAVGGELAPGLLAREERRAQQTLAAAERRTNVVGAFHSQDAERVRGLRLCLVDDVMTTGATLSACADALAAAGAARVSAVVFARDL
jgi:predicted amidophosphoribosyltransferase